MTEKYGWSTVFEIYGLLNVGERRRIIVLFSLMVGGMGLEMHGRGLIIPAVTLLLQTAPSETYPPLAVVVEMLGQPPQGFGEIQAFHPHHEAENIPTAGAGTAPSWILTPGSGMKSRQRACRSRGDCPVTPC